MLHIYMEYYLTVNKIESFVVICVDLEYIIQSEVSQKEKNTYCIHTHTHTHTHTHRYGIYKNDTDEPVCMPGIKTQL